MAQPQPQSPRRWRIVLFTIVTALFGLQLTVVGLVLIAPSPWAPPDTFGHLTPWHSAQSAANVGILGGIGLLAALWRPCGEAAILQLFLLSMLEGVLVQLLRTPTLGLDVSAWVNLAVGALPLILYPWPRELFRLDGDRSASRPLLLLTGLAALLLLSDLVRNLGWQFRWVGDEEARRFFWLQTALMELMLVLLGALVAIKRPGWAVLGVLLGAVYLYLGAVALTIPPERGSWGSVGGGIALLVGLCSIALTAREAWLARTTSPAVATGVAGCGGALYTGADADERRTS
jgi:hypothetical protein